jgi:hypothetical protein
MDMFLYARPNPGAFSEGACSQQACSLGKLTAFLVSELIIKFRLDYTIARQASALFGRFPSGFGNGEMIRMIGDNEGPKLFGWAVTG